MKRSQLLYFFLCVIFHFNGYCQDLGEIHFVELEFNFGEIQESDGAVTHAFEFANIGTSPVVISEVKASCGCTTPGWSHEPILPEQKGVVNAQFNPTNRPGAFRKSLTVTSNATQTTVQLFIYGKVVPRNKAIEEDLPLKIGALRLKSQYLSLGKITNERIISQSFDLYNDSNQPINFTGKYNSPDFIELIFEPRQLSPKSKGQFVVNYNPNHSDYLGLNNHGISFTTMEEADLVINLSVTASISEFFPDMSPEKWSNAPKLLIEERFKDIGQIPQNQKVTVDYVITNAGNEVLNIRKIETNCSCLVAEISTKNVSPLETTTLKLTLNSEQRKGNQTKMVTLYSNDPADPTQMVTIKAVVSE